MHQIEYNRRTKPAPHKLRYNPQFWGRMGGQPKLFMPMFGLGPGGKIADVSPSARNATISGGVTWQSGGFAFNGSTGLATIAGTLPVSANITIWAIISATSVSSAAFINSNDNSGGFSARGWQFRLDSPGVVHSIFFSSGNTNGAAIGSISVAGGSAHFIATTWDGLTIRNYVDGTPDGTGTFSGTPTNIPTASATIGNGQSSGLGGSGPFNGTIYQHGIIYATLNAVQIRKLANRSWAMFTRRRSRVGRANSGLLLLRRRAAA